MTHSTDLWAHHKLNKRCATLKHDPKNNSKVAHRVVWGNGHLTWEWTNPTPIRSSLHPLLFAPALYLVKLTHIDHIHPFIVELAPRLLQGTISAIGDLCFIKFFQVFFILSFSVSAKQTKNAPH